MFNDEWGSAGEADFGDNPLSELAVDQFYDGGAVHCQLVSERGCRHRNRHHSELHGGPPARGGYVIADNRTP